MHPRPTAIGPTMAGTSPLFLHLTLLLLLLVHSASTYESGHTGTFTKLSGLNVDNQLKNLIFLFTTICSRFVFFWLKYLLFCLGLYHLYGC